MAKVALVTGGAGGIGTAICRQLADDGFSVVTTYLTKGSFLAWQEKHKPNYDFQGYYCDVSDWDSCVAFAQKVLAQSEQVDVLVNNAGITRDSTFVKMTPQQWQEVMHTNLDSAFNLAKQFVPDMMKRGWGRVVNISSVNGQKGQFGQTNYSAAKAGIHGFSKALAQETVRKGVTVNTISPGYIGTSMVLQMSEEVQDKIRAQIPMGRFGEPQEIANMVAYLASDKAAFITGANFSVNGGQHMF